MLMKSIRINTEEIKAMTAKNNVLMKKLEQNKEMPCISFDKMHGVEIIEYEPKYVMYENTFDFDRTFDRTLLRDECDTVCIFRVLMKNIGNVNIEKISIKNFRIMYITDIWDDNPEQGYYALQLVEHHEEIEKCINILSKDEEYVQVIMTKCEEVTEDNIFFDYYQFDRLYVDFEIKATTSKEETRYRYSMFLSKINGQREDMKGNYGIDYSTIIEL